MDIRVFELPTRDADIFTIERKLQDLEELVREGFELDEVELDWMETANTWLVVEWSNV